MSAMHDVLQVVPEADRGIVTLETYRMMNTLGGRPSDCARSQVRLYQGNRAEYMATVARENERTKQQQTLERLYTRLGLIDLNKVQA